MFIVKPSRDCYCEQVATFSWGKQTKGCVGNVLGTIRNKKTTRVRRRTSITIIATIMWFVTVKMVHFYLLDHTYMFKHHLFTLLNIPILKEVYFVSIHDNKTAISSVCVLLLKKDWNLLYSREIVGRSVVFFYPHLNILLMGCKRLGLNIEPT